MKKVLLLTLIGSLFAAVSAFAGPGCNAAKATSYAAKSACSAEKVVATCPAMAEKACSDEKKANCAEKTAVATSGEDKKADETAAVSAAPCCPVGKAA